MSKWPSLKRKLDKVTADLEIEGPVTEVEPPVSEQLSSEAKQILIAACEDERQKGTLIMSRTLGGTHFQGGSKGFGTPDDPRSVAVWKCVFEELERFGLISAMGYKGEVFEVTKPGWNVFDQIKSRQTE